MQNSLALFNQLRTTLGKQGGEYGADLVDQTTVFDHFEADVSTMSKLQERGECFKSFKVYTNRRCYKCTAADCSFQLSLAYVSNQACYKLGKKNNPLHSCDGTVTRKRKLQSKRLMKDQKLEEIISTYPVPDAKAASGVKELLANHDHIIGRGQSYLLAHQLQGTTLVNFIESYQQLPSYFDYLREVDEHGTYLLENIDFFGETQQFSRCYMAHMCQKKTFEASCRGVVSVDGTFLTGLFGGIALVAVARDADNHLTVLAIAIVESESEDSWLWFLRTLVEDFPGITVLISDADKGLWSQGVQQLLNEKGIKHKRCYFHLAGNLEKFLNRKLGVQERKHLKRLSAARTARVFEANRDALFELTPAAQEYLTPDVLASVATYTLTEEEIARYGTITSNNAEAVNSLIVNFRGQTVGRFLERSANLVNDKHQERANAARLRGAKPVEEHRGLTEFGQRCVQIAQHLARGWNIRANATVLENHELVEVTAQVNYRNPGNDRQYAYAVTVNRDGTIRCTCKQREEMGFPCTHAYAIIRQRSANPGWDPWDTKWVDPVFHLQSYQAQYPGVGIASMPIAPLSASRIIPPKAPTKKGRRKARRWRVGDLVRQQEREAEQAVNQPDNDIEVSDGEGGILLLQRVRHADLAYYRDEYSDEEVEEAAAAPAAGEAAAAEPAQEPAAAEAAEAGGAAPAAAGAPHGPQLRRCHLCGVLGHMSKSCRRANTIYLVKKYFPNLLEGYEQAD